MFDVGCFRRWLEEVCVQEGGVVCGGCRFAGDWCCFSEEVGWALCGGGSLFLLFTSRLRRVSGWFCSSFVCFDVCGLLGLVLSVFFCSRWFRCVAGLWLELIKVMYVVVVLCWFRKRLSDAEWGGGCCFFL